MLFSSCSKSWHQVSRKLHLYFNWYQKKLTNYFEGIDILPKCIFSSWAAYFLDAKKPLIMSHIINLIAGFWKLKQNVMLHSELTDSSKSLLSQWQTPSLFSQTSLSSEEIYYLMCLEVLRSNNLQGWLIQLLSNVTKLPACVSFSPSCHSDCAGFSFK